SAACRASSASAFAASPSTWNGSPLEYDGTRSVAAAPCPFSWSCAVFTATASSVEPPASGCAIRMWNRYAILITHSGAPGMSDSRFQCTASLSAFCVTIDSLLQDAAFFQRPRVILPDVRPLTQHLSVVRAQLS